MTNSTELETSFTKYKLTKEEAFQGSLLSDVQRKVIQNLLSDIAEEKIAITYDPTNPLQFAQQEADLTGKISILRFILITDEESKRLLSQSNQN